MRVLAGTTGSLLLSFGFALGACGESGSSKQSVPNFIVTEDGGTFTVECDGKAVGTVERRVRYQTQSVKAGEECLAQDQTRRCEGDGEWSEFSGDYTAESCKVEGFASCDGMPHGTTEKRDRYEVMSVASGKTCEKQAQTRVCEDGTWSAWSGTFTFETCAVDGAASCGTSPDGTKQEQKRYQNAVVPFGSECKSEQQTRECKMGTWSAWTGTFKEENCRVTDGMSCGNTPHAGVEKRTRYKESLVEAGQTCQEEEQTRTCTNGTFSAWSGTFSAEICDVKGKRRCGETKHGDSEKRIRYLNTSEPFGKACQPQEQTRTCNDGTFGEWTGTYTVVTCTVEAPKACGTTPHGGTVSRVRYQAAQVPFGTQCVSETQVSTCNNGVFSAYTGSFTEPACSVALPLPCDGVPHDGTRTQIRYQAAEVPFGSTCVSETQTSKCSNGTWSAYSGTFTAEKCAPKAPAPCGTSAHGAKEERTRYETPSVAAGSTCNGQTQSRTCSNGTWSAWTGTFKEEKCIVRGRDCAALGEPTILDGASQTRVRYEALFPAGACKPETQTRVCKDGTFGAWSGTYKGLGCSPLPATSTGVASCRVLTDDTPQCREWRGANLSSYQSQCNGTWDATRGCPTEGTAIGKCSANLANNVVTSNFAYVESAIPASQQCLFTLGTWTDL